MTDNTPTLKKINYSLSDYYQYAQRVSYRMKNMWDSNEKDRIDAQVAYHHWLNQDDLVELNERLAKEEPTSHGQL